MAAIFIALAILASGFAAMPANTTHQRTVTGPGNYYAAIDTTLNGAAFREQLTALIVEHTVLSYNDLWAAFRETDRNTGQPGGCQAGQVGDVYSFKCWDSPAQQCGNYKQEGDCFNRCALCKRRLIARAVI